MNCFITDLPRSLKDIRREGKEIHVLKTKYNALLLVATDNLEAEFLYSLRLAISANGSILLKLDVELELQDGITAAEVLNYCARDCTYAVYYKPLKLYFIDITSDLHSLNIYFCTLVG